jgi:hypothetical protein
VEENVCGKYFSMTVYFKPWTVCHKGETITVTAIFYYLWKIPEIRLTIIVMSLSIKYLQYNYLFLRYHTLGQAQRDKNMLVTNNWRKSWAESHGILPILL